MFLAYPIHISSVIHNTINRYLRGHAYMTFRDYKGLAYLLVKFLYTGRMQNNLL